MMQSPYVPAFGKVFYEDVYPGVDMVYYGNHSRLEYDFVVQPGADPTAIHLSFTGAKKLAIDDAGNLLIYLPSGRTLLQHAPVVYQETKSHDNARILKKRVRIDSHYVLDTSNKQITFAIGQYDHSQPLVIDPVLVYSTYIGGSTTENLTGIAIDSLGNAYVCGDTASANFPTQNSYQTNYNSGCSDGFVTKLSSSGSQIVYSTYLGGMDTDFIRGIAVDSSGNAYVGGYTASTNYPIMNPYQPIRGGGYYDGFVTKLSASGSQIIYSTYLGGAGNENINGIAVDPSGSAYVDGNTTSMDFPTLNPFQASFAGGTGFFATGDGFVTKLSASGSQLIYSTYLGGTANDRVTCIVVDSSGNAYVGGATTSTNFPTLNPYQASYSGSSSGNDNGDGFVTKLSASGSQLIYSTYIGGSGSESITSIAIDSSGSAYLGGYTDSTNFPTLNPYQASYSGGYYNDGFVTKLSASGSQLIYSTYIGGTYNDAVYSIAVDSSGNAYIGGNVNSPNFPMMNPYQATNGGGYTGDGFVTKLNPSGSQLLYSTFLGGGGNDSVKGVTVDSSGNAYVGGTTTSPNLATVNSYQSSYVGSDGDGFVAKFAIGTPIVTITQVSQSGSNVTISGTVNVSGTTIWVQLLDANGNVVAEGWATVNPDGTWTITFANVPPGSYTLKVTATNPDNGQVGTITHPTPIIVNPGGSFSLAPPSIAASVTLIEGSSSPVSVNASPAITILPTGGFQGTVALSVTGAPATITASLAPPFVTLQNGTSATSTLSFLVGGSTPAGTYNFTVTGTSNAGTATNTVAAQLTVTRQSRRGNGH